MPDSSMLCEHREQRQLHLGEQRRRLDSGQLLVERRGQIEHRLRAQDLGLGTFGVDGVLVVEQRQLGVLGLVDAQLATQVAQREVVEVEAALPRPHQVGGERGVAAEPVEGPPATAQRMHGELRLVDGLRLPRVGEPRAECLLVLGV